MNRKLHKLLPAVAMALASYEASGQVLYDPFNYTTGATLDSGTNFSTSGTFWSQRGAQTGLTTIAAASLGPATAGTVPVLPEGMGGSASYPSAGVGRTPIVGFGQTFTTPGDYYYSMTIKAPSTLTVGANQVIAGMSNFSIPTPNAPGVFQAGLRLTTAATNFTLGMSSGGTAQQAAATFNPGDTVFVVARYRIVAGTSNDQVAMWINPTSGFGDNGAAILGTPSLSWNHTSGDSVDAVLNNPMLAGFFLRSQASSTGFQVDEVRVDSTWAGVTPDGTQQFHFANTAGGSWSGANWQDYTHAATASNPNAAGQVANFGSGITSGSTITVDGGGRTVDTVNLNNAGSLTIGGTDTLTFGSPTSAGQIVAYAGTHTVSAPVASNGNLSIKTQGSGTSVALNSNVTMTGASKTIGLYGTGTVTLGASNLIDDTARLEVRSGTLNLNGNSETVDTLQLGTSHPNNGSAISLGVTYNGDLASGTISNGTITASNYDLQSGTIGATLGGTANVVKNQSGVVTLSGNNTYSGNTVVNQGVLRLTGTNSSPVNAVLNPPTSERGSTSTLLINADNALGASGATVTITTTGGQSGMLQFGDNMTLAANRSIVANAAGSRIAAANGKTANIDAPISGTGGINVTYPWDPAFPSAGVDNNNVRFGAIGTPGGVVVLRGTNTYAGSTTVSGGRLLLPTATSAPGLGTAGKFVTVAPPDFPPNTTSPSSTPSSRGGVLSVAYGGPSDWSVADVDILRTTTTWGQTVPLFNAFFPAGTFLGFDTSNATGPVTYGTTISSGNHGVSKHGAGTLDMTGDLAMSGNILGEGGTLRLSGNATNAGAVIVTTGATLENTGTLNNGGLVQSNGGTLILAGNNGYAGQTQANLNGVIVVKNSNGLGSTAGNTLVSGGGGVDANSTLQLDGSGGDLSVPEPFTFEGKSSGGGGNPTPHINNTAGNNTTTGEITFATGGSFYNIASNGGKLTIGGTGINNPLTGATLRQLNFRGTGLGEVTSNITNSGAATNFQIQKFDSGTWTFSGVNAHTGGTTVNGGTLVVANADALGTGGLTVNNATARAQAALPKAVSVATVTLTGTGKLDMTDNDLVIKTSTLAAVQAQITAGFNGGTWDGAGINSSAAATHPNATTALGYGDNAELGLTTFSGVALTGPEIIVKYTYYGDADLTGVVDLDDFGLFLTGYQNGSLPRTWIYGDFDYTGVIDLDDFGLFLYGYQNQGGPLSALSEAVAEASGISPGDRAAMQAAISAVPEPASLGVLALAGLGLMGRRQRRSI